jgi:hypothetical protein
MFLNLRFTSQRGLVGECFVSPLTAALSARDRDAGELTRFLGNELE